MTIGKTIALTRLTFVGKVMSLLFNMPSRLVITFLPKSKHLLISVRTEHGTTDWFKIRKGVCQGCILSLCLFNLYAEYIMRNAGLDEAQARFKIAGRNVDSLRCMEGSEEELKSLLMKVKKESVKADLKFKI